MPKRTDWLSVLQFGLSLLAALGMLFFMISLLLFAVTNLFIDAASTGEGELLGLLMLAANAGFTMLLLLPSAWYSLLNLFGQQERALASQPAARSSLIWLFLVPILLSAGYGITRLGSPWVYLLPIFHVLVIGGTAAGFYAAGSRGLSPGSRQRFWGLLASGLVLGPVLILIIETVFLIVFGLAALVNLTSDQELLNRLIPLLESFPESPQVSEQLLELLTPWLSSPLVWISVLVFAAVLVPLVEEALKPIGIWLIFRRPLTPGQGFAAGLLSGAAYGIFESLPLTVTGEGWASVMLTRAGTTLLHIFTTGVVGWGLATTFQTRRIGQLSRAYLAAVILHGLWNSFTLLTTIGELNLGNLAPDHPLLVLGRMSPVGILTLASGSLVCLLVVNRWFVQRLEEAERGEYNGTSVPEETLRVDSSIENSET
jgi:hypothetical protein